MHGCARGRTTKRPACLFNCIQFDYELINHLGARRRRVWRSSLQANWCVSDVGSTRSELTHIPANITRRRGFKFAGGGGVGVSLIRLQRTVSGSPQVPAGSVSEKTTPESWAIWRSPVAAWLSLAEMPVRAVTTRFMYKGLCTIPDVLSLRSPVILPEDEVEGEF